jgi:predicted amidohydrolase YtcJ
MNKPRIVASAFALIFTTLSLLGFSADNQALPGVAATEAKAAQRAAAQIFSGGTIITMDPSAGSPEAIAVRGGRIVAMGSALEIEVLRGVDTHQIDLAGRTLLPGFIDGHSHFAMAVKSAAWANVSGIPVGKVANIADILSELQAQAKRNGTSAGDWIVGYGYDADTLSDGRGVTRDDLDVVFPDNPVVMIHVSFHGAVLNSKAFAAVNYDETTATPPGGVIVRREGSNEPLGLLMETAWFPVVAALPVAEGEARFDNVKLAQAFYASQGVTTAQEGYTSMEDFSLLKDAAQRGDLYLDLVALGGFQELEQFIAEKGAYADYNGRLKLAGIKIIGDGSPQGKTAFFTEPYLTGGPAGEKDWRGEPVVPQETMDQLLETIYGAGLRAFVHANGDAAVDVLLNSHKKHAKLAGKDSRTVIIHSQFMRREQLDDYALFGMVPSFFSNHTFFWGDVHVKNLGTERAHFLSPMKSAGKLGIHFTNHSDYAVTPLDPLFTVWSAVNRLSRSGKVIGEAERITPYQALKAITLDGAWQFHEEDSKGSITVGKLADLVILDGNPLTVDPMAIKDIKIMATYKEGDVVYTAKEQ